MLPAAANRGHAICARQLGRINSNGGAQTAAFKVISAHSHIVEPSDMYTSRVEPKCERAPWIERRKTPNGRDYDAWVLVLSSGILPEIC